MFTDDMTIREAKVLLRELADRGHECPVCTQLVKIYRRKVHATMARGLILLYRAGGNHDYIHAPSATRRDANVETAKLVYWNLTEQMPGEREDGGRHGWYRLTPLGIAWVERRATIPKYARIYNDRVLRLEGDPVTITEALGTKFRYDDLMAGV